MSQSESAFATRIVCDDFSACVFCFCDFLVCFVRIRSFATPSRRSPRLEEEDAETRGQNDDALARRLELADARADERGDAAFGRVLTERSLGPVRKLGALSPFSTRTRRGTGTATPSSRCRVDGVEGPHDSAVGCAARI